MYIYNYGDATRAYFQFLLINFNYFVINRRFIAYKLHVA